MVKKDSAPRAHTARTRLSRPIKYAMAVAFIPLALPVLAVPAAHADALPSGPGQCLGADCSDALTPAGNGPFSGPDGTTPDGTTPDSMTDNSMPDGTAPDSTTSDSSMADGSMPSSTMPDNATSDSTTPDSTTPDSTAPDSTAPDSTMPDSSTPADMTSGDAMSDNTASSDNADSSNDATSDDATSDDSGSPTAGGDSRNWTGSTTIIKVDERTGRPLAGAVFQLWHESNGIRGLQTGGGNPDTKVGSPCTTRSNGECSTDDLPLGTYYWQELTAPPGYDLPDETVTKVVLDRRQPCSETVVKDRRSYRPTGSTSVRKVDERTGKPLAGATFQLWRETNGIPGLQTTGPRPDTKVDGPCVTPSNGVCAEGNLPLGTYYWQEIAAPPGYDLPDHPVTTVVLNRDNPCVQIVAKDRRSYRPTGSTSVRKVDERTGKPLAGATFQLWRETNGIPGLQTTGSRPDTKVDGPCVTPASGICSEDNLPLGTYYWQEIAAPPGYDLPGQTVTTVVLARDHDHVQIVAKDRRMRTPRGYTSVKKVDARKGQPLAGATFQLWRETNGVPGLQTTGRYPDTKVGGPCVTPASGICSAANLPLGTYYWQETAAPRGYRVSRHPVTTVVLDRAHPCAEIVVKDWRRQWHHGHHGHLPQTGFDGRTLGAAGASLLGFGGLVTVGAKRRRLRRN